jgi:threonine/homoserine/homoserine lactone efflux protein
VYDAGHGKPGSSEHSQPGRPAGSLLPVLIVVGCVLAMGVVVVSCAGAAGLAAILAVGGVVGFVALHYLLWGAWLAKKIRQSEQADAGERETDD